MESSFNRLTESDKLRSFVDTRSFEENLAESNAKLFDTETKALGLQDAQIRFADAQKARDAKNAFAQNVIIGSENAEDMLVKAKEFTANNPSYAQYTPELIKNASSMYEGADQSKQRNLALRQQEVLTKTAEANLDEKIKADGFAASMKVIQEGDKLAALKAAKLMENDNPALAVMNVMDASNPVHVALGRAYNTEYKNAITPEEKERVKNEFSEQFKVFESFRSTQNQFTQDTLFQYGETMNELLKNQPVLAAYNDWYEGQVDKGVKMNKQGAFVEFLGVMSESFDAPNSIGSMIARSASKARELMSRAYNMKMANAEYNNVIGKINKETGAYSDPDSYNRAIDFGRLKAATTKVMSELESERLAREAKIAQREKELGIQKSELDIEATEANRFNTGIGGERRQALEEEISDKRKELAYARRLAAQKPSDFTNGLVVTAGNELKDLNDSLKKIDQGNTNTSIESPK